jgi:hypothetical protein
MNLPWDFHERCRASLETEFLRDFFSHGAGIARNAAESGGALSGADDGVCVAALRLMAVVLAWDFARGGGSGGAAGGGSFGYVPESARGGDGDVAEAVKISPGPGWRDALLAPGGNDWLFGLHAAAHAAATAKAGRCTLTPG